MDINTLNTGLTGALNTASTAVKDSGDNFARAAKATTDAFAAGANELAASFNDDISLEGSTYLSSQNTQDPLLGIVDMKMAEQAYKANLETMKTADEMMEDTINRLA